MKEKVSALMDGELSDSEARAVIKELETNSELRKLWQRYQMMSAALNQDLEGLSETDLAKRVRLQLDSEPVVLAPGNWVKGNGRRIAKVLGSLAIAASVAAIAVLSLKPADPLTTPDARIANLRSVQDGEYIRAGETRWDVKQPALESTLNMYLVEHSEYTPTSGLRGMMSYGRVVSYDRDK